MSEPSGLITTLARTGAPRIASFIVTVWGDAVAPRGGSLWLGSLQAILDRFGCSPGQVRTAMSRLTEEGWLARNRVGRNSFYRLGPRGEQVFGAAATRIYAARPPDWDGAFRLVLLADAATREALEASGFGTLPGGTMLGIAGDPERLPRSAPMLHATPRSMAEAQLLAARAWPLETLAEGYGRFLDAFAPLRDARVPPADALPLRLLLVHEWRRLVLRDPLLPAELLPAAWPGTPARVLAAELYHRLAPDAEAWLDAEGRNEDGVLPPALAPLRFAAG
ncbi:PaaX family transcriptional regulator C-terminal domain-containing protein [Falsiroseomonas oryzae]|uniref:PaaX family transcriptional regulator C-terminal domain-containing protein n=1 Tax=Falsiroseomonas oryzae TaxID=2766473 RepID=UPI0022EABE15|nr:PaaX family transcriptional regulator C-terminal domain-containing protein [Roseomonas sp. MO-31]